MSRSLVFPLLEREIFLQFVARLVSEPKISSKTRKALKKWGEFNAPSYGSDETSFRELCTLFYAKSVKKVFLTSIGVAAVVIFLRFLGMLQPLELMSYDILISWRPPEKAGDERVAIIEISAEELRDIGIPRRNPTQISYENLRKILRELQKYKPRVIGLDIYIDEPDRPDYKELVEHIKTYNLSNEDSDGDIPIIVPCLIDPNSKQPGAAPEGFPEDYLGFTNFPPEDRFGFSHSEQNQLVVRRYLLTAKKNLSTTCNTGYSLGLLLAMEYLSAQDIDYGYVNKEGQEYIKFENKKEQRITVLNDLGKWSSGGYRWREIGDYETLLNYRSVYPLKDSFFKVNVKQILDNSYRGSLEGLVVLIGYHIDISSHYKDIHKTPFTFGRMGVEKKLPGVQIHAHMVSQILSAVLDDRLQIVVWPFWGEWLWIGFCSMIVGGLAWKFPRPSSLQLVGIAAASLLILSWYFLSCWGWWIPFIPPLLAVAFTVFLAKED